MCSCWLMRLAARMPLVRCRPCGCGRCRSPGRSPLACAAPAAVASCAAGCWRTAARCTPRLLRVRRTGYRAHRMLGERIPVVGVGVDRADHLFTDRQRQGQHRMHTHACHPAAEAWPAAVAAQRAADRGSPGPHAADARTLAQLLVLQGVDDADELDGHRPRLDARVPMARVDQRDARAVGTRDGLHRELCYLTEHFVDAVGACDNSGQSRERGGRSSSSASSWAAVSSGSGGGLRPGWAS